jgi:hypothetical protein
MGYVIAGILVLLIVAGFITFLVMNSMRKSGPAARGDAGAPGIGEDATPLGDTTEHAGRQTSRGTTSDDAERNAGEDTAEQGHDPSRPARPEDRQLRDAGADSGAPQPQSERLADRPR